MGNKKTENSKQYNVVDIFSGVGGLSFGFEELSQFKIVMWSERRGVAPS